MQWLCQVKIDTPKVGTQSGYFRGILVHHYLGHIYNICIPLQYDCKMKSEIQYNVIAICLTNVAVKHYEQDVQTTCKIVRQIQQ